MAVEAFKTVQQTEDYRQVPVEDHGKLRYQYFNLAALTVVGDAASTVDLCELPPGRIRILPWLSRLTWSAFGASRILDVGHREYRKSGGAGVVLEPLNGNAFANDIDVSAAGAVVALSNTVLKYDVYSLGGVVIHATVGGGTMPIGLTLSGLIAYLYE
jgi:hypothetical protein